MAGEISESKVAQVCERILAIAIGPNWRRRISQPAKDFWMAEIKVVLEEAFPPPAEQPPDGARGARMEQLRGFVKWEKSANPGKIHIAEWALQEIERLQAQSEFYRHMRNANERKLAQQSATNGAPIDTVREPAEAQAQGGGETDPMLTVAARNLRSYLSKASFSSAVDKRAAENCVEVLVAAATAPPSAPVGVEEQTVAWTDADMENPCGAEEAFMRRLSEAQWVPVEVGGMLRHSARLLEHRATALRSIYDLLNVETEADAGAEIARLHALAQQPAAEYQRQQPCGCVLCVCEDEKQCHGCGAKHCGNRTDHPAYVTKQPAAVDGAMVEYSRGYKAGHAAATEYCVGLARERRNA